MLVKTIDGTLHPKDNCRKISGEYYLIGNNNIKDSGQCYLINDKYYKSNTGYIEYDHYINQYVIKNSTLNLGIVNIDENGDLIFGYYSKSNDYLPNVYFQNKYYKILNEESIIKSQYWIYDITSDVYIKRKGANSNIITNKSIVDSDYKYSLPYSVSDKLLNKVSTIADECTIISEKPKYNTDLLGNILTKYPCGIEFETISGVLSNRLASSIGLIALRDGSIDGLEYVTIPLKGNKGATQLRKIVHYLDSYTEYDKNCALHFHFSGIPRNPKYLLSLLRVLGAIEDDIFNLFPIYKRINFGIKKKAYTKPLPFIQLFSNMDKVITSSNAESNFEVLHHYLSMGSSWPGSLKDVTHHPADPGANSKWNMKTRYHWVNLIPIIFGNKKTVEFRLHTPTTDITKIVNFIIICAAILHKAEKDQISILEHPTKMQYLNLNSIVRDFLMGSSNYKQLGLNSMQAENIYETISYYIRNREHYISKCMFNNNVLAPEEEFVAGDFWDKSNLIKLDLESKKYKNSRVLEILQELDNTTIGNFNVQVIDSDEIEDSLDADAIEDGLNEDESDF